MDQDERAQLSAVLLQATQQMFAPEGRSWQVVGNDIGDLAIDGVLAASIGLGGADGLKGKLVIIARPEFFRSVYPPELPQNEISEDVLADWASEVANQLLGRIKNLLSARAVNFALSIPAVIAGDRLRLLCRDRPSCLEHS